LEHKKASARPCVGARLFNEVVDRAGRTDFQNAEPRRRFESGYSGNAAVAFVKLEQPTDVHIPNAVAIGQHEGFAGDVLLSALEPTTHHCVQASTGKSDQKVLLLPIFVIENARLEAKIDGEIVCHGRVIQKVLFNHVSAVTKAQDEIAEAIVVVNLHDVP